MLQLLDAALETMLRAEVPLPVDEVDVAFQAPDRDWGVGITKPTVNLYMWDIRRNEEERASGWQVVEDENGRPTRVGPRPRVDCRYLVTAWTTEVLDEHALLGQLLLVLLRSPRIARQHLRGTLEEVEPHPTLELAAEDAANRSELWSALDGQLKPALDVVVSITVDSVLAREVGPPVERYTIGVTSDSLVEPSSRTVVGGRGSSGVDVVVGTRGSGVVGPGGEFVVSARPGDRLEGLPDGGSAEVEEVGLVEFE